MRLRGGDPDPNKNDKSAMDKDPLHRRRHSPKTTTKFTCIKAKSEYL